MLKISCIIVTSKFYNSKVFDLNWKFTWDKNIFKIKKLLSKFKIVVIDVVIVSTFRKIKKISLVM